MVDLEVYGPSDPAQVDYLRYFFIYIQGKNCTQ